MVSEEGVVEDITTIDSAPRRVFDAAAVRSLRRWKFSPATYLGKPIAYPWSIVMSFNLEGTDGGSPRFRRYFSEANTALSEGDFETAWSKMNRLEEKYTTSEYERTHLNLLHVNYYVKRKQYLDATKQLREIERVDWGRVKDKRRAGYLKLHFNLEVSLNEYARAHYVYLHLEEVGPISQTDPIRTTYSQLKGVLEGSPEIHAQSKIENLCAWCAENQVSSRQKLVRNHFQINAIQGLVNKIELQCGDNRAEVGFVAGALFDVTDEFGACWLTVAGREGTTFQLTEYLTPTLKAQ